MSKNWFYVLRGQRLGPIAENDLIAMHQSGSIDDDTPVWTPDAGNDQQAWRPYSETGLNAASASIPDRPIAPPPAPLSHISNKYVWLIVFAPIFLAVVELIEYVISGGTPATGILLVSLTTYLALGFADAREIERSGHLGKAKKLSAWWIFIVPVYLWRRSTLLRQGRKTVWIWLALVALNVLVTQSDFAEGVLAGADRLPNCASPIIEGRLDAYLRDLMGGHGLFPIDLSVTQPRLITINGTLSENCGYRIVTSNKHDVDVQVFVSRNENGFNFVVGDIKDAP